MILFSSPHFKKKMQQHYQMTNKSIEIKFFRRFDRNHRVHKTSLKISFAISRIRKRNEKNSTKKSQQDDVYASILYWKTTLATIRPYGNLRSWFLRYGILSRLQLRARSSDHLRRSITSRLCEWFRGRTIFIVDFRENCNTGKLFPRKKYSTTFWAVTLVAALTRKNGSSYSWVVVVLSSLDD